nr:hypothetical protein CFP56_53294 [Quercus suber]
MVGELSEFTAMPDGRLADRFCSQDAPRNLLVGSVSVQLNTMGSSAGSRNMAWRRRRTGDDGDARSNGKTFPIIIAAISLVYQFLAALTCRHLSAGSPYVDQSVATYAWIGCVFSLLGLVGAITVSVSESLHVRDRVRQLFAPRRHCLRGLSRAPRPSVRGRADQPGYLRYPGLQPRACVRCIPGKPDAEVFGRAARRAGHVRHVDDLRDDRARYAGSRCAKVRHDPRAQRVLLCSRSYRYRIFRRKTTTHGRVLNTGQGALDDITRTMLIRRPHRCPSQD